MWSLGFIYAEGLEDLALLEQQASLALRLGSLRTVSCQKCPVLLGERWLTLDLD